MGDLIFKSEEADPRKLPATYIAMESGIRGGAIASNASPKPSRPTLRETEDLLQDYNKYRHSLLLSQGVSNRKRQLKSSWSCYSKESLLLLLCLTASLLILPLVLPPLPPPPFMLLLLPIGILALLMTMALVSSNGRDISCTQM